MIQLALGLVHPPPAMVARCPTCRRWVPTTRDGRHLVEHGTPRRDPRRRPSTPRPCPSSGVELGNARRAVYACGCGWAAGLVRPYVLTAFGPTPNKAAGPCCLCGHQTRRAEYYEPGPLCRTCFQPVHRHDPFWHRGAVP